MMTAVGMPSTGTETEVASTVILIPMVFFPTNQADDLPSRFWQPGLSVELDLLVNQPDRQELKSVSPVFSAVFESHDKRNKPQDILQSFRIPLLPECV
jgi:hypothetical protein